MKRLIPHQPVKLPEYSPYNVLSSSQRFNRLGDLRVVNAVKPFDLNTSDVSWNMPTLSADKVMAAMSLPTIPTINAMDAVGALARNGSYKQVT